MLVMTLFLIVNVSAGIYFSQPESYYNLGDVIEIEVIVDPILEGFLKVDLVCDGGTVNIFNGVSNEEGKVNIKFPLTFSYIKENSGDCYFLGQYSEMSQQSRGFEISKALDVWLDTENLVSKPGEEIVVSGTAKRLNGIGINGEIELTIPLLKLMTSESESTETESNESEEEEENSEETETTEVIDTGIFYGRVTDGQFSVSFKLREDTPGGDYRIDVLAYEKDSLDRITSEGVAMANLQVLQILKNVEIALDTQSIDPGENFNFKPMLTDQSGQPIYDEVSVIIRDEDSTRVYEQILQSGETNAYQIPANLSAGYYELEASSGEINSMKKFHINEKAIVSFEIINNSLIVTNVGNIPYKKDIQVELNGKPFVRKVNLDLGESQEFKLTGTGEYNVKISDGETEVSKGGVMLTGHAVNVEAVKKGFIAYTPIVWIFFIIVFGAGILFFFRNILKKKSFAYPFKGKLKSGLERIRLKKKSDGLSGTKVEKEKPIKSLIPNKAESVLVLKGHKNRATVLALKIKNKLTRANKKDLGKIIKPISNGKGAVYETGSYLIGVFSPLITKTFKNEVRAAKVAGLLQASLKQYNKRFSDKIEFGIGINSGNIISKIENGKLKFTALGNLIPSVKRIAEASDEKVLLTKDAYEKAGSEVKATKHGDVYEVRRVLDVERNKAFIDGFLRRIGVEKNKKGMVDFG